MAMMRVGLPRLRREARIKAAPVWASRRRTELDIEAMKGGLGIGGGRHIHPYLIL